MVLTEAQLRELSELADALQRLPEAARAGWLANLGPGQAAYRPALQQLLVAGDSDEAQDFLATLPKLDDVAHPDAAGLQAGAGIGPYRLLRELGRGGMGTVWLAERSDGVLKRAVALKLPHSALPHLQLAERFARERDILAGLTHPHIARLYDAGVTAQGQPYLALEFVEGEPLLAWCDGHRLGVRQRIGLFLQALSAVQYAHGQLVVHRDLKPSNMLVTAHGEVRLLDFGIAKLLTDGEAKETELTQVGGRLLTPKYASPEQVAGQPIGTASDVYALGVVLYELLTGTLPYRVKRDSRGALEDAILTVEPARPSHAAGDSAAAEKRGTNAIRLARELKGDLDTIVLKALKKRPEERYATVDAFAADLRRYLAGEPVLARPDSAWYRAHKFALRNRWEVGIAVGVLLAFALEFGLGATAGAMLALAIGMVAALWQAREARRQARKASAAAAMAQAEAKTARAVQDFLRQIFETNSSNQPDPRQARQTTARELLDIGASTIDTSLNDTPEAKAAVLRIVSNMYWELGLNERAAELAEQGVKLLRTLRGHDHPEVADQLVEVSQMIQLTNRSAERGPLLREAMRILDLHPDHDRQTRIRVLRQLALFEHDEGDPGALDHARQAVADSEAIAATADLVAALTVLGKVQMTLGDNAAAEETLLRNLALASTIPEFHRRQRILLIAYLGDAQLALGKFGAAEAKFREGLDLAIQVSGPEHIDVAQMEKRLGELVSDAGRTHDGLRLLESARARVIGARGADNTSFLPHVLRAESSMRAQLGDLEGALPLAENGLGLLGAGNRDRSRAGLMLLEIEITLELDRVADAQAALERLDVYWRDRNAVAADERELRNLLAARILLAGNRRDEARAVLTEIRDRLERQPPTFIAWRRLLQWGELMLDAGEPHTALAIAERAGKRMAAEPEPGYLALHEELAAALAGKALVALGDAAAAIPQLRHAVALIEAHRDPERSPRLADALIALADALQRTGQADAAAQALASAQAILARHPSLASRYRSRWEEADGPPAHRENEASPVDAAADVGDRS